MFSMSIHDIMLINNPKKREGTMSNKINYMEKIDIYVPETIGMQVQSDCRSFEVLKKNGDINRNLFLRRLLVGYYDKYNDSIREKSDTIKRILSEYDPSHSYNNDIINSILNKAILPQSPSRKGPNPIKLSLKPSKDMSTLMMRLKNSVISPDSLSQYLCRMIMSYCGLPFYQRERVLFKDLCDDLSYYCQNNMPIAFSTKWNPDVIHEAIPFDVITGKEEMYNYVLCAEYNPEKDRQETVAYRINRLINVNHSRIDNSIDSTVHKHLKEMVRLKSQYTINDDEEVRVRLHNNEPRNGTKSYSKIYFGRPEAYRREQNELYEDLFFKGSSQQLFLYFRRFGEEAEIISPEWLRTKMEEFHTNASNMYKNNDPDSK